MYSFRNGRNASVQRSKPSVPTKVKRGDVFYVYKSPSARSVGSETYAARPGIVVSSDKLNGGSDVVEVVYLTTSPKADMQTHVEIKSLNRKSIALCEQVNTVDKTRLGDRYGEVTEAEIAKIDLALRFSLGMPDSAPKGDSQLAFERDMYKNLYEGLLDRVTRKEN